MPTWCTHSKARHAVQQLNIPDFDTQSRLPQRFQQSRLTSYRLADGVCACEREQAQVKHSISAVPWSVGN